MKIIPLDMLPGTIHETKFNGKLKIIEYIGWDKVSIEFIATGHNKFAQADNIRIGTVKDPFLPSVFGIGFLGVGPHKVSIKSKITNVYYTWNSMISRCYSDEAPIKNPSYAGCTVCVEWHNFQTFGDWFVVNFQEGLQIDKDIKFSDNKIYSPKYCMFVKAQENSEKAHSKNYKFLNPNGELIEVYNLTKFCRENNLSAQHMCSVHKGKRNKHRDWRKAQ